MKKKTNNKTKKKKQNKKNQKQKESTKYEKDENKDYIIQNNIEEEEMEKLEQELININEDNLNEINNKISISEEDSDEQSDDEKIDNINEEFLDTTDINDILSKEGKQFKSEPNQYMDLKGNLNTNDNPFIKASNNQNAKKQKNKISNSQSKYKYNKKPPTKFDTKNSKELDINYIEVMEEDKDGDYKKTIFGIKNLLI